MDDPNRISRLSQYRRDRSRFACIVYSLAVIFFGVSILQWILMILIEGLQDVIIGLYYVTILALIISMLMVTAFVFFENLRFTAPVNWFITLIIVLATTWGIARAIVESNLQLFGLTVLFVLLLSVIFIMIGVCIATAIYESIYDAQRDDIEYLIPFFMIIILTNVDIDRLKAAIGYLNILSGARQDERRHDLTLDIVVLFVVAVIFFIISVFLAMLQIVAGVKLAFHLYTTFIIITVIMFMMYHAQTINGFRYAEMRINDFLLAALIIYHDMTLLLIMCFYWVAKLCDLFGITGLRLYGEACCEDGQDVGNETTTPAGEAMSLYDGNDQLR